MEGMPRFVMIAPDCKKAASSPEKTGFSSKIRAYIRDHFGQDPSDFDNAIKEFLELHEAVAHPYPSVELTCIMKRYYAQLKMLANRFPLDGSHPDMQIAWSWHDCLQDSSNVVSYVDVEFEMATVMFNIAAVHARIASDTPRDSEDGIKNAFMHFGYAAYPLQYLRDEMNAQRFATADFDQVFITFFLNTIMAQAQECMVEKALVDHRNPLVISRLTSHLFDVYAKCGEQLESSCLCDILSSSRFRMVHEWMRLCSVKSAVYGAVSMLYLGIQAEEEEKHGERVAHYSAAAEHIKHAVKMAEKEKTSHFRETVLFVNDIVTAKAQNAKKENDLIYHAKVPKPEEIKMAEPLSMACAYSFNPTDRSISGQDLFAALLPSTVVKAVSQYEEMKAQLKRGILAKVAAYDQELEEVLNKLQLPDMLRRVREGRGEEDDECVMRELPEEMLERNAFFSSHSDAIPTLLDQLHKVAEFSRDSDGRLSSLESRLAAIQVPQLATDEGVKAIRDEITRLLDHNRQAKQTNTEVQRVLAEESEQLHSLSLPLHSFIQLFKMRVGEGETAVPPSQGAALLRLGDKVEEMKKQRAKLLFTLGEDLRADELASELLLERDRDPEDLFSKAILKHNEVTGYIEQNLKAQEKIVEALLEANADMAEERRRMVDESERRRSRVLALVSAADVYFELAKKVEEAQAFYSKLTSRVEKLSGAVEGIEAAYGDMQKAREEEERETQRRAAHEQRRKATKDAMKDFSIPVESTVEAAGGRESIRKPRQRGDYMEMFRRKMAERSGTSGLPYSGELPPPPPLTLPPQQPPSPALPSPAPSTVSNGSCAPPPFSSLPQVPRFPPQPSHSQYNPVPPAPSYSQPSLPVYHHPPPPAYSLPPGPTYSQPAPFYSHPPAPYSQPPAATYSHPPASSYTHPPTSSYPHPPAPSYPQPSLPPVPSVPNLPPQHAYSSGVYGNPPHTFYRHDNSVGGETAWQPPSTMTSQAPMAVSTAWSAAAAPSMVPHPPAVPSITHPPPPSMAHPAPPSFTHPPPPPPSFSSVSPTASLSSALPSLPTPSSSLPPPPLPPQPSQSPGHSSTQPSLSGREVNRLPSLSELSAALESAASPSPSPWHRGLSTATRGMPSSLSHPHPPAPSPFSAPPSSMAGAPSPLPPSSAALPPLPQPQRSETLDLLSSIFSDSGLPPPLLPCSLTTSETQKSYTTHISSAVSGDGKTATEAVSSTLQPRPAAAVLPMQQLQQLPPTSQQQVLSMMGARSVAYSPSPSSLPSSSLSLDSVIDVATFELGVGDEKRLEKRLLHASIRGDVDKPPLSSNDPLNSIDAFWKAK